MINIGEIIDILQHTETVFCRLPGVGDYELCSTRELNEIIIPEPRQLALDELRQMEDGYVWIEDWNEDLSFKAWGEKRGDRITALIWNDVAGYGIVIKDLDDKYYRKLYGKEWTAYDRPPGGAK